MDNNYQKGQVVIVLLLMILVGLTIAIAANQRSLSDLSNSAQNEQSARAFSTAEAGIERAISIDYSQPVFGTVINKTDSGNQSTAEVKKVADLPSSGQALEEPQPVGRTTIAQFWLANPDNGPPAHDIVRYYSSNTPFLIYFGDPNVSVTSNSAPAIEVNLITADSTFVTASSYSGDFLSKRFLFDPNATRRNQDNFDNSPICPPTPYIINTTSSPNLTATDRNFKCLATINPLTTSGLPSSVDLNGRVPILVRVRMLYADDQPLAVAGFGVNSLPPQLTIYTSKGTAGQSTRVVQVSRKSYVYPPFLDFAIFSYGEITKPN